MDLVYAEWEGLDKLLGRFGAVEQAARKAMAVERIGQAVEQAMQAEAPEGCTGNLRRGIKSTTTYLPGGFSVEVQSEAYYTRWVIAGRGWVYPVRARALHWVTCSGEDVFAMYARPTEPNPFHERAWSKVQGEIANRWAAYAESYVAALA